MPAGDEHSLDELYRRPGFLLRRAHQVSVALFLEEAACSSLTATQFDIMVVIRARGTLDQASIAKLSGIDRSTSGLVVDHLEKLGYLECRIDPVDKRRKMISLANAGRSTLADAAEPAERASRRALQALSPASARKLMQMMRQFIDTFAER